MMPRFQILICMLAASSAMAQPVGDLPTAPQTPETPVTALPQINLPPSAPMPEPEPATQVPVSETPIASTTTPPSTDLLPTVVFSYGNAPASIFFTRAQISNMKKALSTFENIRPEDAVAGEMLFTEELPIAPAIIEEPATYPVYHLSSIVYRTPTDWTVWLNGARITPKTNDGDVTVTAVRPDRAWFSWKPTYIQPLTERINQKTLASTDAVKHRFTTENTASVDRKSASIRFSLRPNQSFAASYFRTFEGKIATPKLPDSAAPTATTPGMTSQAADAINGLLGATPSPAMLDPDRARMNDILNNQPRVPTPTGRNSPATTQPQIPTTTPSPTLPQPTMNTSTP